MPEKVSTTARRRGHKVKREIDGTLGWWGRVRDGQSDAARAVHAPSIHRVRGFGEGVKRRWGGAKGSPPPPPSHAGC
jgi:hypothetical protein